MSRYNYKRRLSRPVKVGSVVIGGEAPICLQSMTNTNTNDVGACVEQALRIVEAGGELVRLTTQGTREADSLGEVRRQLRSLGCDLPLSADVHFNPQAAFRAAGTADKVRINPGNFVDAARTFVKLSFTDEEYAAEIDRIRQKLIPFLELCSQNGVAIRLGVNHGSLSDRIMSRYGDTPAGMVESVMEYLRICEEVGFKDIVISIKASNTAVMVETVRLLAEQMDSHDMHYPLHLGVTEAGDAEDGRIKSAVGIGTLLAEGLGDTIRVSLSEPPENEIPVARLLRDYIVAREGHDAIVEPTEVPECSNRSYLAPWPGLDASRQPVAFHADDISGCELIPVDASEPVELPEGALLLSSHHKNPVGEIMSWLDRYVAAGGKGPVIMSIDYETDNIDALRIMAAADLGALLLNGYGSGIRVGARVDDEKLADLELSILQAARCRMSKTEYISCPGCGRTLFDLQETLARVKAATSHLKHLKIGVMGCIVNGPGEMADADYGYVGAGPGRVSIYKGKTLIKKNIPTDEALPELLKIIQQD